MERHQHAPRSALPAAHNPQNELAVVEGIQRLASESSERVIVFPEAVVPQWNSSTEVFWEKTLDGLRAAGKTIIVGTKITFGDRGEFTLQDFSAAMAILEIAGHPCSSDCRAEAAYSRPIFSERPRYPGQRQRHIRAESSCSVRDVATL